MSLSPVDEKGGEFKEWVQEHKAAFKDLKTTLTSAVIFAYPHLSLNVTPFIYGAYTSSHAIGTALLQVLFDNKEHVISYGIRALAKTELNYSTTLCEMLALVSFTKKYSPVLKAKRFNVRSDHQAFVWLNNFKSPNANEHVGRKL